MHVIDCSNGIIYYYYFRNDYDNLADTSFDMIEQVDEDNMVNVDIDDSWYWYHS